MANDMSELMTATAGTVSRTKPTPIPVPRTQRNVDVRVLSSFPAGKMAPLAAFPLLREDRLRMSRFRLKY